VQRYQTTNSVEDLKRSGRKRVFDANERETIYNLLLSNDHGSSKAVAERLPALGITSKVHHRTTITRAAKAAAESKGIKIRAVCGKPKKLLSTATLKKRLAFSVKHKSRGWTNVMFTDRKKFHFAYPGAKVSPVAWVVQGEERRAFTVNHASCVNVYAGVTKFGMTAMHIVAGTTGHKSTYMNKKGSGAKNITAMEYRDVLRKTLLPEGRRIFAAQGISNWVLQQDNDPTHKVAAGVVAEYNLQHAFNVSVLPSWPPSSPDLSLIENVWAYLQTRMNAKGCKTFVEFKSELEKEIKAVPQDYTKKLFVGMQQRLQECITKEGNLTKH
jgi:hypothetical protein